MTQQDAADAAGVVDATWRRYEKGERDLSFDQLEGLARAVGSTRDNLLLIRAEILGESPAIAPGVITPLHRGSAAISTAAALLPIRDRVQAGAWLQADDYDQEPVQREYPALRDLRYPHAEQWLSEVVGDSIDRLYIFEGDLVQCVSAIAIGYAPKGGDIVEVERTRLGGHLRELTLKQVEITEAGEILLCPRSTNPRWREPIRITADGMSEEHDEVRIRGLVLSAIRRFT